MKLNKSHVGQKFICPHRREVAPKDFFILAGFFSNGDSIGEDSIGASTRFDSTKDDWLPYEEPKEKVLMSPALCKQLITLYLPEPELISKSVFSDLKNAKNKMLGFDVVWPLKIVLKNVKTEQGFFERMEAEFYVEVEK